MSGEIEKLVHDFEVVLVNDMLDRSDGASEGLKQQNREKIRAAKAALLAHVSGLNEQVEGPLEALRAELANVSDVNEHLGTLNMDLRAQVEQLEREKAELRSLLKTASP